MSYEITNSFNAKDAIVVGIDGRSIPSHVALWAADVASRRQTPLVLVHGYGVQYSREVIVTSEPTATQKAAAHQALTQTAEAVQRKYPDLEMHLVATEDEAAVVLGEATREAWLVALGATTMSRLAAALLSKTSTKVISMANGPVAIIPDATVDWNGPVVLALDIEHPNEAASRFAFEIADWVERPLEIITAWRAPKVPATTTEGVYDASTPHLEELMAKAVAKAAAAHPTVEMTYVTTHGDPVDVLKEATDHARVMIMGSRGHVAGFVGSVAGSTARKLIDKTSSPLVIVTKH